MSRQRKAYQAIWEKRQASRGAEQQPRNAGGADARPTPALPWHPYRNKTEYLYAGHLGVLQFAGEIESFSYETITMHLLGDHKNKLTPDFMVVVKLKTTDQRAVHFHEIKGFVRPDFLIKWKIAKRQFPQFHFHLIRRVKGQWEES